MICSSKVIAQENEIVAKIPGIITIGNSMHSNFPGSMGYNNVKRISWGGQRSIQEGAKGPQRIKGETALFKGTMVVENLEVYPDLFNASTAGTFISELEIDYICTTCSSHGGQSYYNTKFQEVIITSVSINPENITEVQISFDATGIEREFRIIDANGAIKGTVPMKYSLPSSGQ